MNFEQTKDFLQQHWNSWVLATLQEYTTIPNVSPLFDPDWDSHGYMEQAAHLLVDSISNVKIQGISHRIIQLPNCTPLILIEVEAFQSGHGNVLLYGHYDKQPAFTGWDDGKGPWIPVLENGRLYGRGTGDDGYAIFSCLTAIAALQQQGCAHPRCVILIEGCEESGSPDLPTYMEHLKDEIGPPDVVVCLDAECGNYDQLWLTTSLRGVISGTLHVHVLTEGIHSGAGGGIVPSSFRILRALLERLETQHDGTMIEEFHKPIPTWVDEQSLEVATTLGETVLNRYPWVKPQNISAENLANLVTANTWSPCLEVVGILGVPRTQDAGNTLRPYTSVKISIRLPPNCDPTRICTFVKQELERDIPSGTVVNFELDAAESGWFSPEVQPWLNDTLHAASNLFFGNPCKRMGTGGTIPFMKMLGNQYPDCQFVVTGVLGPHSNAHGPNEFLDLKTAERVTGCVSYLLNQIGSGYHNIGA